VSAILQIFLDLETTGLELSDRICSFGYIVENSETTECYETLIKPSCKIKTEAMAVHHITNEQVATASSFSESKALVFLNTYNNDKHILVGHNINFDLEMLAREGFIWQGGIVDTLRCSRHLIEEIDRFSLQYLRYELGIYKTEALKAKALEITLQAHSALSDAFHVQQLYHYLNEMVSEDELMRMSVEPALLKKLNFGKYKGHYIEEVASQDRRYLEWLLQQDIDEDLSFSIRHYL